MSKKELEVFEPDDPVWLRNYSGNPKWIAGTVVMKTGPVSYKVMSGDHIYKRHVDQMRKRSVNVDETSSQSSDEFFSIPFPPSLYGTKQEKTKICGNILFEMSVSRCIS